MPTVSVITPCFNDAAFIPDVVASVQAQDLGDWEHVIIDDGSTDGSRALLQEHAQQDERIKPIFMAHNQGAGRARNAGIAAAQGRYIAFLDADDLWAPSKLSAQIDFMTKGGHAFSFTSYRRVQLNGVDLGIEHAAARVTYRDLLSHNQIGCLTAMYDSAELGKLLMPDIRQRQDWGLWLRILQRAPAAYGLNEVLATYRQRSRSLSANKMISAGYTWRLYREIVGFSRGRAAWLFAQHVSHHARKIATRRITRVIAQNR